MDSFTGAFGEHEVSLQTALAVMKAFDYTKYEIKPFYITKEGDWRAGHVLLAPPDGLEHLQLAGGSAASGTKALMPVFQTAYRSKPLQ